MNDDQTEFQTAAGLSASKKLSMQATTPPAEVPGYRLNQFLGAGAFGQVWVGRDLNTGRDVAVKFYLHRGGVNWSLLSREVKNLVQLSADRYVVQVLEVGWDADPPYYVMELVTGGSLEDLLRERQRLPVDEAVSMFRRICIGLNRCHAKGVLHCDMKPANILLGDDQEPRLADFGQSRLSSDQTPALGTLFYMAPEQADLNSTPDASWDVYAVGAIMFRMLTGNAPYRHDDAIAEIDTAGSIEKRLARYRSLIRHSDPPEEHLAIPDVDRALGRIISKCLAVDPKERYANVQQVLQDLNRRDATRARWPLMLLGIVGPLLVLLATVFFGYRSINEAGERTLVALRDEAASSNQMAATFAARTLEHEIENYFRLTREESTRQPLVTLLEETLKDPVATEALDQIASMGTPAATFPPSAARSRLLDVASRKQLDQILAERLKLHFSGHHLASMFITDANGTILSIAYSEPVAPDEISTGKNYCYRTYFHGGPFDLPLDRTKIGSIQPLSWTHLSSAFQSTATGLWKVAVSTPMDLDSNGTPDAVFVVTINLGDFDLPQTESGKQVAVLVEARKGPVQGTILQHPLMDSRLQTGASNKGLLYQIPPEKMQQLLTSDNVVYHDPLGNAPDGQSFAGPWIAAMQPVSLPRRAIDTEVTNTETTSNGHQPQRNTTDLLVLVQYRLQNVLEPVEQMRTALMWEGAAAIISILAVTITLWLFVRRAGSMQTERRRKQDRTDPAYIETVSMPLQR